MWHHAGLVKNSALCPNYALVWAGCSAPRYLGKKEKVKMTECEEVAANMQPPARIKTYTDLLAWVKSQMPDETSTIQANVAEAIYLRQQQRH